MATESLSLVPMLYWVSHRSGFFDVFSVSFNGLTSFLISDCNGWTIGGFGDGTGIAVQDGATVKNCEVGNFECA